MTQPTCKERVENDKIQNEQFFHKVELEHTTLKFVARASTD